jgi:prepilin-type N-terminal cleavage/methylation domain-containing protein
MKGFTIIEVLIVLTIFITLLGIGYVSVVGIERRAPIGATVTTLIADLRGAQTKAMAGVNQESHGISLAEYSVPENIAITTTFPGYVVTFARGSGDIIGFSQGNNTVTVTQTLTGEHKTIIINRYGAVTEIQ